MEVIANRSEWYVLHCRPQRETQVATTVPDQLGLSVYLPAVMRRSRGRVRPSPLFPGYIFVKAKLQGNALRAMQAIPGVLQLLAFGGLPQPVPEAVAPIVAAHRVRHVAPPAGRAASPRATPNHRASVNRRLRPRRITIGRVKK